MITVAEIRNTCSACPAQWEGKTDDGRWVYIRLRHGCFRIGIGETLDDAIRSYYWGQQSEVLDGFMSYEQLKELTSGILNLPEMETECP